MGKGRTGCQSFATSWWAMEESDESFAFADYEVIEFGCLFDVG